MHGREIVPRMTYSLSHNWSDPKPKRLESRYLVKRRKSAIKPSTFSSRTCAYGRSCGLSFAHTRGYVPRPRFCCESCVVSLIDTFPSRTSMDCNLGLIDRALADSKSALRSILESKFTAKEHNYIPCDESLEPVAAVVTFYSSSDLDHLMKTICVNLDAFRCSMNGLES